MPPTPFASGNPLYAVTPMHMKAYTASDSNVFTDGGATVVTSVGVYVGTAGNISAVDAYGNAVSFNAVPVGWYPWHLTQIKAMGTTAGNFVIGY